MGKAKFIVIEGTDGSGKSSQLKKIQNEMIDNEGRYKKHQFVYGKEPTYDSPYGIELRQKMKESKNPWEDAELFVGYMVKDREHHCRNFIIPNLSYGATCITDRYKHSTYAYQQAQGVPFEIIDMLHKKNSYIIVPDLTLIFHVPAEIAAERIAKRESKTTKFEQKDFLERVIENYLKLPEQLPGENIIVIDATKSIDDVFSQVKAELEKLF